MRMPRYKFTSYAGPRTAILRGKAVKQKASPFEMAGFSLELHPDDLRALAEEALRAADRSDEYATREARVKAGPKKEPA